MNDLTRALRQVVYTNNSFWRNPVSAFFTLIFPIMFLVIFSLIFGNQNITIAGVKTTVATFYVPAITVFAVITACYTNLAINLSFQRDSGVLKRTRGTPLPAWAYMFGRIAHCILLSILLVIVCATFGRVFYNAALPSHTLPAFLLTLAVGAATFCALGILVTALVPNADASPAVVNGSVLPLLFVSNVFIPLQNAPAWLDTFSRIFPIRHFADALVGSYFSPTGSGLYGNDLLIMAAWGALALLLSVRFFSWEPKV
jgi:ABC-2 type transport system permease protein